MTREKAPGILFIRLRLLGDIVFTIPALQLFRRTFPQAPVHYVVEEKFREIGELLPGVDELIVVPRKLGFTGTLRFGRSVRGRSIGTVVDFHSGPKSALMTWATRAGRRIGYATPSRNFAYNKFVPRHPENVSPHSVWNQARLLEPLGIEVKSVPPYPEIDIGEHGISDRILAYAEESTPYVLLHTGAGNRFRDWGFANFSGLVRRLAADGVRIGLLGSGEEEVARAQRLADNPAVTNFAGSISLRDLIHLAGRAAVYVGADSGPLHVASLTQTPLVAIYGPNLPEISGPWRTRDVVILEQQLSCRPCSQRRCLYDTMKCLAEIAVEEVHEAVSRFLIRS